MNAAVSSTTFWSAVALLASSMGGLLTMQVSHTTANGHSSLAEQSEVASVKIKVERIASEVKHNKELLSELKADVRHIREEQGRSSKQILEAIKDK